METKMYKFYGASGRQDGVRRTGLHEWSLYYGYGEDGCGSYCWRALLTHAPSEREIRELVDGAINTRVQERILSGMRYRGRIVWLSAENQRNLAFATALARGGGIGALPTLKLGGTDEDCVLYTFADADEVAAFGAQVQAHIEGCIAAGRAEKAAVDWTAFQLE